jgi:hypothetical protein
MIYDPEDAARDEFYEEIAKELYPEHKAQAVQEFTAERLRSFYEKNPTVMRPAVDAMHEGKALQTHGHSSAAVVFFVSAIELFLKATLLKPVVYGLVHNEALADIIVTHTLGQAGLERYENLLANLFSSLANIDVKAVCRDGISEPLLVEARKLQKIRNKIIHQGVMASESEADQAFSVAVAVYARIVTDMLDVLGLRVGGKGEITQRP